MECLRLCKPLSIVRKDLTPPPPPPGKPYMPDPREWEGGAVNRLKPAGSPAPPVLQGARPEVFLDVVERLTVVIAANVS